MVPFPGPGPKRRISTLGGQQPTWNRDGREILYLALDNKLMAVGVDGRGTTLKDGAVQQLFESSLIAGGPHYTTADGQRILVTNSSGNSVSLWKAADLTPLGSFSTGASTGPFGATSDGINFWITLRTTSRLARF